ncbi:MAG: helix-turn-helix transcriptional regulator [Bacteroidales bacterium]|nr:helix-turn-helix transcriptional regulator [Bacteroidales bacterium]
MNKRLQQFLAAENISQSQFADSIGVARASISHILAGRNKPGFDFLESMSRHYPELNLEWLITGRGKMYRRDASLPSQDEGALFEQSDYQEDTEPETPLSDPNFSTNSQDRISQLPINQKTISKIMVFYSDGSYQELP